ncbi:ADGRL2 [Branchiostoma lanceolatum]|uniref:ADGRL2 protein n=1 Tax=Branchiostoma lanceolatum TaxID=7740 RepID=A0A8K0EYP5_BRALA|nr:ADGRL2 [Branchiostoma lanceolatum]
METKAGFTSVGREDIDKPQQTGSQKNEEEGAAGIDGINAFPLSVGRGIINEMYGCDSSKQGGDGAQTANATKGEEAEIECVDADDPDTHVYQSIDEDDIANQRQAGLDKGNAGQATDKEKDNTLPKKMQSDAFDLLNNPTYVSGAQDKDKASPMSCCMVVLRSRLFRGTIIAVAAVALVAVGFLTVAFFTVKPENGAEPKPISSPTIIVGRKNQNTEKQETFLTTKKETAFACWKKSLHLSCPAGQSLSIDDANWGRTSATVCPPCNLCNTNCCAPNSLSIMRGACESLQKCTVRAREDIFGDPCKGTEKYLEATYHCVLVMPVTDGQLEELVTKYAPKVWLAQGEQYNPSSVAFHLQHVEVYDGRRIYSSTPWTLPTCSENCYLSTTQPLRYPESQLPFFSGEEVGPTYQPPVYAVVKRINPTTTDIFYWMFYSYNGPKKVCIGLRLAGSCIGGYQTFTHHVGDWEHVTVRLVGKHPQSIYVRSAHESAGGHKLWPSPGTHPYLRILLNENLQDETSKGTAWDAWKNVPFTFYRPEGGYTGSWSWLNYEGRWGNRKAGCTVEQLSGQCIRNDGPPSITTMPPMKSDELD